MFELSISVGVYWREPRFLDPTVVENKETIQTCYGAQIGPLRISLFRRKHREKEEWSTNRLRVASKSNSH